MVFVSVGTQKQDFSRLFKLIENSIELENEEIIAQIGYTKYVGNRMKTFKFIPKDEMQNYFKEANYIICHGGVGTIFDGLYMQKKILAVPRLKKFKEHVNDHQLQICSRLEDDGYLLYLNDGENFDEKIKKLKKSEFKKYEKNEDFLSILREKI